MRELIGVVNNGPLHTLLESLSTISGYLESYLEQDNNPPLAVDISDGSWKVKHKICACLRGEGGERLFMACLALLRNEPC
jgi:hypothetical protein